MHLIIYEVRRHLLPFVVQQQPVGMARKALVAQGLVVTHHLQQLVADGNEALLVVADTANDACAQIQVGEVQRDELADTDAGG